MTKKRFFIGTFEAEALEPETNRRLPYQVYYPADVIKKAPQFSYYQVAENKKKILAGIRESVRAPYKTNYGFTKKDEEVDSMPASHVEMAKKLNDIYKKMYFQPARLGKMPEPLQQKADYTTNFYDGVAISEGEESCPVVILSHGWVTSKECMAYIAEALAMAGYIAVSVQHTYLSMLTTFANGDVAGFRPNLFVNHCSIMADDENIVIEDLKTRNQNHEILNGKLDFTRMGVVGFSAGASGAMWNAAHNPELKAFLGIDSSADHLEEETIQNGMPIPSMFLRSEERKVFEDTLKLKELQQNSSDLLVYMVPDTQHRSFGIMPYGPQNPDRFRVQTATNRIVLSFFDHYLRGIENDLLKLPELDENIERL